MADRATIEALRHAGGVVAPINPLLTPDEAAKQVDAPYEKLREVERVEEIPKSASGKILRRLHREEHGAARAAS